MSAEVRQIRQNVALGDGGLASGPPLRTMRIAEILPAVFQAAAAIRQTEFLA
jgi:hypothetical protein